jgi:flavin reductase (DIM6/NTAB) family NADH-FMN oxidoreductase RutF
MSEEGQRQTKANALAENLAALEAVVEEMRNLDEGKRHLLFEKALELVHACQALIDEEEPLA